MDRKRELLNRYFGYENFRNGQEPLIDSILSGRDSFGIMPTGGGKSMCYQLPALMMKGITLVISPLISLMKDQVLSLKNAGISAAYINSSLTASQLYKVYGYVSQKRYKIIYVAPERLFSEGFLSAISGIDISFVAVDEAHCISQWGQDFRPSYLKIPKFIESLPFRPVLGAFTATATDTVRDDIIKLLSLKDPFLTVTGFDRPNLYFDVLRPSDRSAALISLIKERHKKSGIVYCTTRKDVEKITELLRDNGFRATRYHAGLSDEERLSNQDDFIFDRSLIMVATNAFGMGIDKSNVSYVIHYGMPKSPEAYYQEAGRAGRDGTAAECILLFAPKDIMTAKFLINNSAENEELSEEERSNVIKSDLERLDRMVTYSNTTACLRSYMLKYFGQKTSDACNNCGNCRNETECIDITSHSQLILSSVIAIKSKLGYTPGEVFIIKLLRGSKEQRLTDAGMDKLSTYGRLKDESPDRLRRIFDRLLTEGYLIKNSFDGIEITKKADRVLYENEKVFMLIRKEKPTAANKSKSSSLSVGDAGLYDILRAVRMRLARKENVPAYVIFSNATLQDMTEKMPLTREEFLTVSGVGQTKAELYADIFLEEIRKWKK